MRRVVQKLARGLGYQITRTRMNLGPSPLADVMLSMLSWTQKLNIVQIGANDGSTNDPIFGFVSRFPQRTRVLLIEPQAVVIPYLKANYAFHPDHRVYQGLIGPAGSTTLFSVSEDVWNRLEVPYAKGWPVYRAPTGITSTQRDHVDGWVKKYLTDYDDHSNAIVETEAEGMPLTDLVDRMGFIDEVDVLQVDAEGTDDQVIYHCDLERSRPRVINYESANLAQSRRNALERFLEERGYVLADYRTDTLAILKENKS